MSKVVAVTVYDPQSSRLRTHDRDTSLQDYIGMTQDELAETSMRNTWSFLGITNLSSDPLRRLWVIFYASNGEYYQFIVSNDINERVAVQDPPPL